MTRLTQAQRDNMPDSEFGEPATHGFPMPDKNHAQFAEAMATRKVNKGTMSASTAAQIKAKAKAKHVINGLRNR